MPLFRLHEASVPFTCTSIFKLSKTKNILLDILTRDYGFHLMQVQYFIWEAANSSLDLHITDQPDMQNRHKNSKKYQK